MLWVFEDANNNEILGAALSFSGRAQKRTSPHLKEETTPGHLRLKNVLLS